MFNLRNMAFVYIFLTALLAVGFYTTPVTQTYAASTVASTPAKNKLVNATNEIPLLTTPDTKYFSSIPTREYYVSEALAPQQIRTLYAASGFFLFLSMLALNALRIQRILQPVIIDTTRIANLFTVKYRNMTLKITDTLKGERVA